MRALKATASGAAETLDERLARARSIIDELSLLTASGDRIAERFDRASDASAASRNAVRPVPRHSFNSAIGQHHETPRRSEGRAVKSVKKYLRLLPAVVIVGTGLLAIKGVDLARAATAPTQNSDEPDNSGLAPTDNGGAPATRDFAAEDGSSGSAAEVDVLSSLTRRRAELDARERALNMRENGCYRAGEGRVDQKDRRAQGICRPRSRRLLVTRDAKQDDQIKSLVKTYSAMKPKDAARIFNSLSDDVLVPVAEEMKSDVLAPVLAAMNPEAAQKLTVKLAMLLKLPEPAPAICPIAPGASSPARRPISPRRAPARWRPSHRRCRPPPFRRPAVRRW